MTKDTTTDEVQLSAEMHEATVAFADSLLAAPPFAAYHKAEIWLEQDPEAQSLLERLQTFQASIRMKQANGQVTHNDIASLRNFQSDALANRTIAAYVESQQAVVVYLRDINQEINQMLGVDFAALAKRTSC